MIVEFRCIISSGKVCFDPVKLLLLRIKCRYKSAGFPVKIRNSMDRSNTVNKAIQRIIYLSDFSALSDPLVKDKNLAFANVLNLAANCTGFRGYDIWPCKLPIV